MTDGHIGSALTEDTLQAALDVSMQRPVLVSFEAEWCLPCERMGPIFFALSEAYAGRVALYRVDADRETKLSERFSVLTLPTVLILSRGAVAARTTGPKSQRVLANLIDEALKEQPRIPD